MTTQFLEIALDASDGGPVQMMKRCVFAALSAQYPGQVSCFTVCQISRNNVHSILESLASYIMQKLIVCALVVHENHRIKLEYMSCFKEKY